MDKNLNTDFTENTDLAFSLIFLVGKCFLDFYQDFVDLRVLGHSLFFADFSPSRSQTYPDLLKGKE